jgi:hypothetical protein
MGFARLISPPASEEAVECGVGEREAPARDVLAPSKGTCDGLSRGESGSLAPITGESIEKFGGEERDDEGESLCAKAASRCL